MKKPDAEEIVLKALYAEAIHHGDFNEVTSRKLEMDSHDFAWSLYVLQMRGLIDGCRFQPPHPSTPNAIMGTLRKNLMLTPKGFETIESETNGKTTAERLEGLWKFFRDIGVVIMANELYSWIENI